MIHYVGDGRPWGRKCFVDGVELAGVFYADVERRFARYWLQPTRVNRRKDAVRWAKKRGTIEVYQLIDPEPPRYRFGTPDYFRYNRQRFTGGA